ncbi:NADPH-dependent ferric siderophore reductase [Agrobacterium larrymoorei]|uniref:NADPH-dependent ferric siderophore reductase n=2 Tax=Agrobacterium larrymoorei TaxID=160699 RepID=A0AAJ2ER87_9HYPH|nr:NADPH-dependent ferric siderophore reductase [Agrobacterium larrymoorei]
MMAPFTARARVTLADAERFTDALLPHLESHAKVIHVPGGARILSTYGTVLLTREQGGLTIEAACPTPTALATVRTFLADHIFEFSSDARIVWSGAGAGERRPQQFQMLEVIDAFTLTPRIRRIRFSCENAAALASDAHHHIRLLIPPAGRRPIWPALKDDGRLDWPDGDDMLASRVYTLRAVDCEASTITVDIVLHPSDTGAPGTHFAGNAMAGDLAGLLGPGGSGMPATDKPLLLLGDETAMPAIARIIEGAAPSQAIEAIIAVECSAETAYLTARAGSTLTWLCRNEQQHCPTALADMLEAKLASMGSKSAFVWAGCEQRVARQLRQRLTGRSNIESLIAAYWQRQRT